MSFRVAGARDCGSCQHVLKTEGFRAVLEVEMLKKCTPLWREAHLEVKLLKTRGVRTTFGTSDG